MLLYGEFGLLTIPGIVMALVNIYLIIKDKYIEVAVLSVLTAVGSFFAQSVIAFCLYCTFAASLFALSAIFCLIIDRAKHVKIAFSLIVILIAGLYSLNSVFFYHQSPIIEHDGIVVAQEVSEKAIQKPSLYISPTCESCTILVEKLIQQDPKGENWLPVTIPYRSLHRSETMLKEMGYKGEIETSNASPTGFVPVLIVNENEIIRGSKIIDYIKESEK